jgi:hypothetical protein
MSLPGYKFNPFSGELFPLTTAKEAGAAKLECPVKFLTALGAYTLQLEDSGGLLITQDGVTINIPGDSIPFPVGTQILVLSYEGQAAPVIQAAGSVTVTPSSQSTGQVLIKTHDNNWILA